MVLLLKFLNHSKNNMWFSHFKIAYRFLLRNMSTTLIHVLGLSTSLAMVGMVISYLSFETSFDKFHKNHENVFRIAGKYAHGGDQLNASALTTFQLAKYLETKYEEIESIGRIENSDATVKVDEDLFFQQDIYNVDPSITEILSFNFLHGKPNLSAPAICAISRTTALKYFNRENAVGEIIEIEGIPIKVEAIFLEFPENSHLKPSMLVSMETSIPSYPQWVLHNWSGLSHYTYVKLRQPFKTKSLISQINEDFASFYDLGPPPQFFFQNIASIHLHSNLTQEISTNGKFSNLMLFGISALLILVIASINYINITSAGTLKRIKEIGVKKIFGYSSNKIVTQFQIEAILLTLISLVVSLIAIEWFQFRLESWLGLKIGQSLFKNPSLLFLLLGVGLIQGFIAGSFPALILAKTGIIESLKGKLIGESMNTRFTARDFMVITQFTIAIILLIVSSTIYRQVNYMLESDRGFDSEQLVAINLQNNDIAKKHETIKHQILDISGVKFASATNNPMFRRISGWRGYEFNGASNRINIPTVIVDEDFFTTIGARMVEGRTYSKDFPSDKTKSYIINEAARKFLDKEEVLNSTLTGQAFTGTSWSTKEAKVVGVVNDFHFASMHEEIQPIVFSLLSEFTMPPSWIVMKIDTERMQEIMNDVKVTWSKVVPDRPLQYEYVDQVASDYYQGEISQLRLIIILSCIGMAISLIGLLGLTLFIIQGKIKEMGIRKVLGASLSQLLFLFTNRFTLLILLANIVAWPLAYMINRKWLADFAYHVDTGWIYYILSGFGVLSLAYLVVSSLVVHTSKLNPTHALRNE